jgi:hypothetical protein
MKMTSLSESILLNTDDLSRAENWKNQMEVFDYATLKL